MKTVLLIVGALVVVGIAAGIVSSTIKAIRKRIKAIRKRIKGLQSDPTAGKKPRSILHSVTEFLFITTQVCALGWVSVSYGIAVYSTVVLMQPFPATELSQQAIDTILRVVILKVIGNIFEHNDGPVFGTSAQKEYTPPDEEEGAER